MSDSNNSNNPVDLTGPDEPAKKLPKLLTGFFRKYDPTDPAQVAAKVDRERKEANVSESGVKKRSSRLKRSGRLKVKPSGWLIQSVSGTSVQLTRPRWTRQGQSCSWNKLVSSSNKQVSSFFHVKYYGCNITGVLLRVFPVGGLLSGV